MLKTEKRNGRNYRRKKETLVDQWFVFSKFVCIAAAQSLGTVLYSAVSIAYVQNVKNFVIYIMSMLFIRQNVNCNYAIKFHLF